MSSSFGNEWIVVDVNNQSYGMSAKYVLELQDCNGIDIVEFPGCREPVVGLFEHRDRVLPVIDTRLVLGDPTFESQIESVKTLLATREQDHAEWLEELRRCCQGGTAFTKATDPTQCSFGKWFAGLMNSKDQLSALTNNDPAVESIVRSFERPHRAVHSIAEQALELAASGNMDGAMTIIDNTWNDELAELKQLFAKLHETLVKRHRPRLAISQTGEQYAAFMIDGIQTMVILDDRDIQPVEKGMSRSPYLMGVYSSERFGEVFMLDVAACMRDQDMPSVSEMRAAAA